MCYSSKLTNSHIIANFYRLNIQKNLCDNFEGQIITLTGRKTETEWAKKNSIHSVWILNVLINVEFINEILRRLKIAHIQWICCDQFITFSFVILEFPYFVPMLTNTLCPFKWEIYTANLYQWPWKLNRIDLNWLAKNGTNTRA